MAIEFDALLIKHEGIDAAYIEPPFDPEEVFGAKRVKVRAYFDGLEYRGSIVRMGGIYMLGVTQRLRRAIGKEPGETVHVLVEKDEKERTVEVPAELQKALENDAKAMSEFEGMSFSRRKDYSQWVAEGKRKETRISRAEKAIGMLREGNPLK